MPDYGQDRITQRVDNCPACGGDHVEMEFKRHAEGESTHRGRCMKSKSWVYLKLEPVKFSPLELP